MRLDEATFQKSSELLFELGSVAHKVGIQSRRLEQYLKLVAQSMGFEGDFVVTPSKIEFHLMQSDEIFHRTRVIFSTPTEINLQKIEALDALVGKIRTRTISLDEAKMALNQIDHAQSSQCFLDIFGYALSSIGFAGFLRCSPFEILLSGFLGVLVFFLDKGLAHWFNRFESMSLFFPSFIVSLIASLVGHFHSGVDLYLVTLSAVIYLVPGFAISAGLIEISYGYTVSGMENLLNGLVRLLVLFAGAYCGVWMMGILPQAATTVIEISQIWVWPSAIVLAVGLAFLFKTPKKIFVWVIFGVLLAVFGIRLGTVLEGLNFGNLLGSFLVVLFGNFWSSKALKPMSLILIPAFIFLVSGSIGFRGIAALSEHQFSVGMEEISHMFVVAFSIGIGMILANGLYRSKNIL